MCLTAHCIFCVSSCLAFRLRRTLGKARLWPLHLPLFWNARLWPRLNVFWRARLWPWRNAVLACSPLASASPPSRERPSFSAYQLRYCLTSSADRPVMDMICFKGIFNSLIFKTMELLSSSRPSSRPSSSPFRYPSSVAPSIYGL